MFELIFNNLIPDHIPVALKTRPLAGIARLLIW